VLVEEEDELRGEQIVRLEDDAFPSNGEELVEIFDRELFGHESTAKLHIVQRNMHEWSVFLHILAVGVALREIVIFSVGLANVVEFVLVEGGTHHDAAHLQVLVVLLVEVSLLTAGLLAEQVEIHSSFYSLLAFLLVAVRFEDALPDTLGVDCFAPGKELATHFSHFEL
jgi:hypothetical protein